MHTHQTQTTPIQRPSKQVYSDYTKHDFLVWETLFNRQMETLKTHGSATFLKALDTVNFTSDRIPNFQELAETLKPITGWSLEVVPNLCPTATFFEFLAHKKFTATCWLRTMEQLDYLEEPDMFHDVFGHAPLLCNQAYVDFFKGISDIALEHMHDAEKIELLGRIYWYTIEFGMIREDNQLKIYGAGIISSKGETMHCLSDEVEHLYFDITTMMQSPYRTDILQNKYFVIDSYEQLYHSLPQIAAYLKSEN